MVALLRRLRTWLTRPYPMWRGAWPETRFVVLAAAAVTLLVLVTRPFGLATLPGRSAIALILALGLACLLVSFAMRVIVPAALQRYGDESRWTVAHQIASETAEIVLMACALLAVVAGHGLLEMGPRRLLDFVFVTGLCALVPIGIKVLLMERHLRHRHERRAAELALPPQATTQSRAVAADTLHCRIRAQDGSVELPCDRLRYVRAEENYVDVIYLHEGARRHRLLRSTLAEIERQLAHTPVARCHRSYLVALDAIVGITGNAQGYRLSLDGISETIPVSRSQAKVFLERLRRARERTRRSNDEFFSSLRALRTPLPCRCQ